MFARKHKKVLFTLPIIFLFIVSFIVIHNFQINNNHDNLLVPFFLNNIQQPVENNQNGISNKGWSNNVLVIDPSFESWTSETALQYWTYSNIRRSTDSDTGTYAVQLSGYKEYTFDQRIATGEDDCYATIASVDRSSVWVDFGRTDDGTIRRSFFRWALSIPAGATITSATLTLVGYGVTESDIFTAGIKLIDSDDCPAFTSNPFNWGVTGNVDWSLDTWSAGAAKTSPDISALIQSFVNRAGYTEGNYIGLRVDEGDATAGEIRHAYAYEGGAGKAARLQITYEAYQSKGYVSQELTENVPVSSIGAFSFRYKYATSGFTQDNQIKCTITYTDSSTSDTGWLTPTSSWQTEDLTVHLTAGKIVKSIKIEQRYDCDPYKPVLIDSVKIYAINLTHSGDISDGVLDSLDVGGYIVNQIDSTTSFNLYLYENDVYKQSKSSGLTVDVTFTYSFTQASYGIKINDSTTGVTSWLNFTVDFVEYNDSYWTLGGAPVTTFYIGQTYELHVNLKLSGGTDIVSGYWYNNYTSEYTSSDNYALITMPDTPQTIHIKITPINASGDSYYGIMGANVTLNVDVEIPPLILHSFSFWDDYYPIYGYVICNVSYWINSADVHNTSVDIKFYESSGTWYNVSSVTAWNDTNSTTTGIFRQNPWNGDETITVFAYQGNTLISSLSPQSIPFELTANITGKNVTFDRSLIPNYGTLSFIVYFNCSNNAPHSVYVKATVVRQYPNVNKTLTYLVSTDIGDNEYSVSFSFSPYQVSPESFTWYDEDSLLIEFYADDGSTLITSQTSDFDIYYTSIQGEIIIDNIFYRVENVTFSYRVIANVSSDATIYVLIYNSTGHVVFSNNTDLVMVAGIPQTVDFNIGLLSVDNYRVVLQGNITGENPMTVDTKQFVVSNTEVYADVGYQIVVQAGLPQNIRVRFTNLLNLSTNETFYITVTGPGGVLLNDTVVYEFSPHGTYTYSATIYPVTDGKYTISVVREVNSTETLSSESFVVTGQLVYLWKSGYMFTYMIGQIVNGLPVILIGVLCSVFIYYSPISGKNKVKLIIVVLAITLVIVFVPMLVSAINYANILYFAPIPELYVTTLLDWISTPWWAQLLGL